MNEWMNKKERYDYLTKNHLIQSLFYLWFVFLNCEFVFFYLCCLFKARFHASDSYATYPIMYDIHSSDPKKSINLGYQSHRPPTSAPIEVGSKLCMHRPNTRIDSAHDFFMQLTQLYTIYTRYSTQGPTNYSGISITLAQHKKWKHLWFFIQLYMIYTWYLISKSINLINQFHCLLVGN